MEIFVTDLETGDILRFPMLPDKITVKTGAVQQSYDIMSVGEVKFPVGEQLTVFSWRGMLPGRAREMMPFVKEWKDPKSIQQLWSVYRAKKKKLRLLITETPVNHDVYLESYSVDYQHGYGDYNYQISFIYAYDLKFYTEGEKDNAAKARPSASVPKTYTVKTGDTLWQIAQKYLGDGSKYPQIHAANQPPIGLDPNKIYPGQVLVI